MVTTRRQHQTRSNAPPPSSVALSTRSNASPPSSVTMSAIAVPSPPRANQRRLARHELADEEPPEEPFHRPAFQRALADTKDIVTALATVLSENTHGDASLINGLREEAARLSRFELPATRKLGLVGGSGDGKSSLINSILDVPNLARSSSGGGACTCVATEYRYHGRDDYEIKIGWFTRDEICNQIEQLLADYRNYPENRDWIQINTDKETRRRLEDTSVLARNTLKVMFSLADTAALLDGTQEDVAQWLLARFDATSQERASLSTIVAEDVDKVMSALLTLTSDSRNPGPEGARWPFIKRVTVFLNAHILKTGLILVDLPGLRDSNPIRSRLAERYVRRCDEIFAVCEISRAKTDETVEHIFRLGEQARLNNIGIVCTKADIIVPSEARTDAQNDRKVEVEQKISELIRKEEEARNIFDELVRRIEDEFDIHDDLNEAEMREKHNLDREKIEARKAKNTASLSLTRYVIKNRNEDVAEALQRKFSKRLAAGARPLNIFCVSNKLYWDNRNRESGGALPYLELSGILSLRQHCLSLVGRAQHAHALGYINDSVQGLIASTKLWVETGAGSDAGIGAKTRICEVLGEVEEQFAEALTSQSSSLCRVEVALQELILTGMPNQRVLHRKYRDWTQAATGAHQEYTGWAWNTYHAFCRYFGTASPSARKYQDRNWNNELFQEMTQDSLGLLNIWPDSPGDQRLLDDLSAETQRCLQRSFELMDDISHLSPSIKTLRGSVIPRFRVLIRALDDVQAEFYERSHNLQADLTGGHRSSIMGEIMESTYIACARECGTGSHERRKDIMEIKLGDKATFSVAYQAVSKRFKAIAEDAIAKMSDHAQEFLTGARHDIDMVRGENAVQEAERDVAFYARAAAAVEEADRRLDAVQLQMDNPGR
ncbi:hypothetical protein RB599_002409 [Gaeumannomyces hyphopodioides]